ncbi:hypothetical protein GUJ93_ZPchr0011g26906 [Zizania palustris]|uniref:Uncharacterized protein n=1 Tax=Zizania palustris TaxID=103762 RepID=A0A8J5WJT5_ZIZPA|nr:hypothetical protein GUJ93_ZPchr0011g26906 [Zizania palustris]
MASRRRLTLPAVAKAMTPPRWSTPSNSPPATSPAEGCASSAPTPPSCLVPSPSSLVHVSTTLTVSGGRRGTFGGRHLFEYDGQAHRFHPRLPRFVGRRGSITFDVEG